MRLRRVEGAKEILKETYGKFVVLEPARLKGKWQEYFQNDNPIHVEFGAGKGRFITTKAVNNENINYIGVEKEPEILLKTAKKAVNMDPANLRLLHYDVEEISEVFEEDEVERIYLNFSDPWPKKRHTRRRLTYESFLIQYAMILAPGGEIHLKTDNEGLFEFSLNEFSRMGWRMKNISLDYHPGEGSDDVATEYEEKFRNLGQRIYRLEAYRE